MDICTVCTCAWNVGWGMWEEVSVLCVSVYVIVGWEEYEWMICVTRRGGEGGKAADGGWFCGLGALLRRPCCDWGSLVWIGAGSGLVGVWPQVWLEGARERQREREYGRERV